MHKFSSYDTLDRSKKYLDATWIFICYRISVKPIVLLFIDEIPLKYMQLLLFDNDTRLLIA